MNPVKQNNSDFRSLLDPNKALYLMSKIEDNVTPFLAQNQTFLIW